MTVAKQKLITAFVLGIAYAALSPALAETYTIYPSGDTSGVTDHANIQSAMQNAAAGGIVRLAAGNFYVNQGIVVTGFNGTLRGTLGENDDAVLTTLEAIAPFEYSHITAYIPDNPATPDYDDRILPSVIFFEYPEVKITVRDLIFIADAVGYVERRPIWGNPDPLWNTTALTQFIADFGNDVDPSYLNLTFVAGDGDFFGSNVAAAVHSMRGPGCSEPCSRIADASLHGVGNAVFKRIRSSHVSDYSIAPMWYKDGSLVIEDVVSDTSAAVIIWGAINMKSRITDVESTNSWQSMSLHFIFGGHTRVRGFNSIGGQSPAVFMRSTENFDIRDSVLLGADGVGQWWRTPVFIAENNRNITIVDNIIAEMINVPVAAVMAWSGGASTNVVIKNNYYDSDNFPGVPSGAFAIVLGSDDSQVVEPGLQSEQVLNVGSNNRIKVGGM